MTTYYLSKDGTDSAVGNFDNPWRTLLKAKLSMAAGDSLLFKDDDIYYGGTHRSILSCTSLGTPTIHVSSLYESFLTDDLIGNYCLFNTYSGQYTRGWKITGVSKPLLTITVEDGYTFNGNFNAYIADVFDHGSGATVFDWTVPGIATTNIFSDLASYDESNRATIKRDPLDTNVNASQIRITDVANVRIRDLILDNNNVANPIIRSDTAAASRLMVIKNCKFQNGGGGGSTHDGQLRISAHNIIALIIGNEFTSWTYASTWQSYGIYFLQGNGAIIGNYIHDASMRQGSGINISQDAQSILCNDNIIARLTGTVVNANGVSSASAQGTVIRNNTVYDLRGVTTCSGFSLWTASPPKFLYDISNNIIMGADGYPLTYGLRISGDFASVGNSDYNWYYNVDIPYSPANFEGEHDIVGENPLFNDPDNGDFRINNFKALRLGSANWNNLANSYIGAMNRNNPLHGISR